MITKIEPATKHHEVILELTPGRDAVVLSIANIDDNNRVCAALRYEQIEELETALYAMRSLIQMPDQKS